MELRGENRTITALGLEQLKNTENVGLQALIRQNDLDPAQLRAYHIGYVIGPCINASGRLDTAKRALELLLESDPARASLLAQELAGMNAGLKVLLAGIRDRYDSDFIEPDFSLSAEKAGDTFRISASFYLPNTMDGDDTAELDCILTGAELKAVIEDLDKACARFPERKA